MSLTQTATASSNERLGLSSSLALADLTASPNESPQCLTSAAPQDQLRSFPAREQQKWNRPRSNIYRMGAVFLSFVVMGANDASYGPLIEPMAGFYNLDYLIISLIFLAPFLGYASAALLTDKLHMRFGQRGNASLGTCSRFASYIILCNHPPYPVVVVALVFTGLGNGLSDAGFNAWVGDMKHANELLGFLHACYGLGATLSPLVASAMLNKYHLQWYTFYYVMIGLSGLDNLCSTLAFWKQDQQQFREQNASEAAESGRFRAALRQRATMVTSLFLLIYTGCEVAIGGWLVTFMIRVRDADPFASGITSTGFWLGITVGRIALGFVTPRVGERWAIALYLAAAIALELLFWLVPNFVVSAVMVALMGFCLGPMFPSAIVALTKILPKRLHVGAVGFASAFGGGGAAVLPFVVGAIAQVKGVQVLQPFILALLAAQLILWLCLPRFPDHLHEE